MAAIDLMILGMLQKTPMNAYEIQKRVEQQNISRCVKISTPSIYKKVLQMEQKGILKGAPLREGRMAEKTIYSLTEQGEREFEKQMLSISNQAIRIPLDLNAVILSLDQLPADSRTVCLSRIARHIKIMKKGLMERLVQDSTDPGLSLTANAVLRQQFALAEALEDWIGTLSEDVE